MLLVLKWGKGAGEWSGIDTQEVGFALEAGKEGGPAGKVRPPVTDKPWKCPTGAAVCHGRGCRSIGRKYWYFGTG